MDKSAIKNFAIWARNKLISDIGYQTRLLGITEQGIAEPLDNSTDDLQFFDIGTAEPYRVSGIAVQQRRALVARIRQKEGDLGYGGAFRAVIEEVAYTWFNRLIAIRFMEVNDYLPSGVRVLSSETGKIEPDMVTTPADTKLGFTADEAAAIERWQRDNKTDKIFRLLFIKQCNALNELLPYLFEQTADYTELLLNLSVTDHDGVVYHLVHDIAEDDFDIEKGGQVEIIGWLYQYYNTELKDETFKLLKKNVKVTKERIPSATQLFTPDWIVRYMVENSLGRIWIQGHMGNPSKEEAMAKRFGWKYYLPEAKQDDDVEAQLKRIREEYAKLRPEDLTILDPCMGSGHILCYAFDVLMQIYTKAGYDERDAVVLILEKNLYGLDIDDRAFQLAYFSVLMKARQYSRRILDQHPMVHLCAIEDSQGMKKWSDFSGSEAGFEQMTLEDQFVETADYLIDTFRDAKEYGSLIQVEKRDYAGLLDYIEQKQAEGGSLFMSAWINDMSERVPQLVTQAEILSKQYDAVVTNPPYMGTGNMDSKLAVFVKKSYPNSKSDLSTVSMERCITFGRSDSCIAMINIPVWMFLASYEKLRVNLLSNLTLINMLHPGRGIFGSDFGTTSFVLQKRYVKSYRGAYRRLFAHQGEVESIEQRERRFFEGRGKFFAQQDTFSQIPGSPLAYWANDNVMNVFLHKKIGEYGKTSKGLITGNNVKFMRLWLEIDFSNLSFDTENEDETMTEEYKWYPCNKGGDFRRWYGNNDWVVNWQYKGKNIFDDAKLGLHHSQNYSSIYKFIPYITWTSVSSSKPSFRYKNHDLADHAGMALFVSQNKLLYLLGLMNTKVTFYLLNILSPTLNYNAGEIDRIPVIMSRCSLKSVEALVQKNIKLSKHDWDSFETSWDFKSHPMIPSTRDLKLPPVPKAFEAMRQKMIDTAMEKAHHLDFCYGLYKAMFNDRFAKLKANEEELNRIFIDIYGLQDELTPDVADKDVTVSCVYDMKEDIPESLKGNNYVLTKQDVVKSLLSYAVGCLFGRYSLDVDGLAYAGGDWDDSKYKTFIPDADNAIPITDTDYFKDDLVGLFCAWLKAVYGADTLEENLAFIADALGNKGTTSRDVIRNYFLKDFYKDHVKTYKKRPIYWLFDSGKQNGFKALVYLHRYNKDTIGNVRANYLYKVERTYEGEIERMQDLMDNSTDNREKTKAAKTKEKLQKQLKECREYDEKMAHLAADRIEIDLDDGVKVNYEKIQTDRNGKKYQILAKI